MFSSSNVASVFDLDGTLIHSRPAVYRSYVAAGVTPPSHFWGQPAGGWLLDACNGDVNRAAEVHSQKNELYPAMLQAYGQALPLSRYVKHLRANGLCAYVITSASHGAATAALEFLGLSLGLLYSYGLTYTGKEEALETLGFESHEYGVYYDDSPEEIKVPKDWVRVRVL